MGSDPIFRGGKMGSDPIFRYGILAGKLRLKILQTYRWRKFACYGARKSGQDIVSGALFAKPLRLSSQ